MAKVVADTYGTGPLQQLFITFKTHFKQGFTKVIVTGGDQLQECLQEDLPLIASNY